MSEAHTKCIYHHEYFHRPISIQSELDSDICDQLRENKEGHYIPMCKIDGEACRMYSYLPLKSEAQVDPKAETQRIEYPGVAEMRKKQRQEKKKKSGQLMTQILKTHKFIKKTRGIVLL